MEVTVSVPPNGLAAVEALIRDGYSVQIFSGTRNAATPWTGIAWTVTHPQGGIRRWEGKASTMEETFKVIESFDSTFRSA